MAKANPNARRGRQAHGLALAVPILMAYLAGGAPSSEAAAAPSAPVLRVADARHADPELEALLPTSLGGVALTVESQTGADLSSRSAAFDAFLEGLGKTRADFSLASAYARDGGLKAEVGSWRVRGADAAKLIPGFEAAVKGSSATPLTIVEETIGGRTVTRIGAPGELSRGPLYVVVHGDALLFVQTTVPDLAAEAMEKLPP